MKHWHLIQNWPLLKKIFTEPPMILFKRVKSLKMCLSEQDYKDAKIKPQMIHVRSRMPCQPCFFFSSCGILISRNFTAGAICELIMLVAKIHNPLLQDCHSLLLGLASLAWRHKYHRLVWRQFLYISFPFGQKNKFLSSANSCTPFFGSLSDRICLFGSL